MAGKDKQQKNSISLLIDPEIYLKACWLFLSEKYKFILFEQTLRGLLSDNVYWGDKDLQ